MRVLVFEPDHTGHHFPYLSLLLPAAAAMASQTILVTGTNAPDSEPFRQFIGPLADRITIEASCPADEGPPRRIAASRAARLLDAVGRHRPDHVMVPYADGIAQVLALRRIAGRATFPQGVSSEALLLRAGFAYPLDGLRSRLRARVSEMLLRRAPFTSMHHLDPLGYERLRSPRWSLMPDPVDQQEPMETADARRRLGLPLDGRFLGCAGIMDTRKGIDLLLHAFARATLRADDRLLLVGPQDPQIRLLLATACAPLVRAGRILAIDRFVAPAEFDAAFASMDLVCTPYPRHIGSASIVIRAAAAKRPVLGSTFGWVGRTIPMFGLGRTCRVEDTAEFADTIRAGLEEAPGWRPTPEAERFVRFHSPENFARAWCVGLRRRLGMPPEPGALTWEWVLGRSETEAR